MSGGAFDYVQYRVDDAVSEIEKRLSKNHKTISEYWQEISDEDKEYLADYEKPWRNSVVDNNLPFYAIEMAEDKANKALGLDIPGSWNCLNEEQRKKWNKIRIEALAKLIEEHNNSMVADDYSDETVAEIQKMLKTIKKASIYLQRIDWLFSGDDGEDDLIKRTKEDLEKAGLSDE